MIKKLLLIAAMGLLLSGCFMAPLAFIGPATSGFSTASLVQSGVSSGASFMVKKSTGKTISEHMYEAITEDSMTSSYFPKDQKIKSEVSKKKIFSRRQN